MQSRTVSLPENFPHRELFLHGRPKHELYDDFWYRHPFMDVRHRAKIFAPFDALEGFSDALEDRTRAFLAGEEDTARSVGEAENTEAFPSFF